MVSGGFAERAAGDDPRHAGSGRISSSFLRTDERDRIFFAREGRGGTPQTLVDIPLIDSGERNPAPAGPDEATSLMLLIDSGVGIGLRLGTGRRQAGGRAARRAGWGNCRWALPMTDRDGRFLFGNEGLPACDRTGRAGPAVFPPPTWWCARTRPRCPTRCAVMGAGPTTSGDVAVRAGEHPGRAGQPRTCRSARAGRGGGAAEALRIRARKTSSNGRSLRPPRCRLSASWRAGVAHDFNNVLTRDHRHLRPDVAAPYSGR